ncbi:hypothetical protein, partial [Lacticaseibacillus paracasei]|uniref:hypothetical protein n=1 Tax=Lacticaseibacillus paracasei TaxID=1597 RepID=UPI002731D53D
DDQPIPTVRKNPSKGRQNKLVSLSSPQKPLRLQKSQLASTDTSLKEGKKCMACCSFCDN